MKINTKYNYLELQDKWDKVWQAHKIYQPDLDNAKNPYYVLYMFPYPSAEGLHVGHAFSGTGADVYARFMRMKGMDVFHPMGFDAFGIHSENYAIKINDHPKNLIDRATKHFRNQFDSLGFSYDWTHSVNTSDSNYYKWTQWLFIQLFKAGLAEKKKAQVNWCPSCKTVLADEQVVAGKNVGMTSKNEHDREDENARRVCERCGSEVERKELEQWFFKITKYADRLLEGLDRIDWTEKVKIAQHNWIGKSEGARIKFQTEANGEIEVFTTRPDTLFGATFLAVSPFHSFIKNNISKMDQSIKEYINNAEKKTGVDLEKEKTGVFSGIYALNPASNEKIPVYIADYVLMDYGTGAIMGVPAHDERDFEFATKYELPIKYVLAQAQEADPHVECYSNRGRLVDSGDWTGWDSEKDFHNILEWIEKKKIGTREARYHLRDWLISRQRYWGAPIPMIHCQKCGWQPVPEKNLPVLLPEIKNFRPLGTGVSPLAQDENFVNTTCPNCGGEAKRETDVADTFLDSSWYFLRYPVSDFDSVPFPSRNWGDKLDARKWKMEGSNAKIENRRSIHAQSSTLKSPSSIPHHLSSNPELEIENSARRAVWLPVPMYIGGAEHSVLHLLYSRFVTKALYDQKLLDFDEPFTKFRAHGLIIKDGAKMSKSRGNVVNPDEYIKKYGADTIRAYLMFLGPFDQGGDFRDSGIEGMERFLKRVKKLVENHSAQKSAKFSDDVKLQKSAARAVKGVETDIGNLRYNTAIAKIMEFVNDLNASKDNLGLNELKLLVLILAPFAPYMTEELWQILSPGSVSVHLETWPSYDEAILREEEVTIAVQVNGKLRDTLKIASDEADQERTEAMARESSKVQTYLDGKEIRDVIYVPGKIINFVVDQPSTNDY